MIESMTLLMIGISVAVIIFFLWLIASIYTVVPPHEAHVVVSRGKGRQLYCSREVGGKKFKSSYLAWPIVQKRAVLPLRNKQLSIDNIPLRDKDLAKFICDVVCWINISNPVLAAERIGSQKRLSDFSGIEDDIQNLVRAVTRNSSMKMDVVKLMSERLVFSKEIANEIQTSIADWGITLVDLECIHFVDERPYTVISDLEKRQSATINSTTRKHVAIKDKEATIEESNMLRATEVTKAENEQKYKTKQIERDEEVGKRTQRKDKAIEEARQEANRQKVEAAKTLTVGEAEYNADATVKTAEGDADATRTKGKADADVVNLKGTAESEVIKKKAFAEAAGIDRKADAQKKYQEAGAMAIEVVSKYFDTYRDIEVARYTQLAQALKEAKVEVISTGEGGQILGIPVTAEAGVALGGMLKGAKEAGIDLEGLVKDAVSTAKDLMQKE